jgi:hypothetical protein
MSDEAITPRLVAGTVINKENINEVARAVLSGATLIVTSGGGGGGGGGGGALIGYTPQFFPTPWVDFVDPVQAGGDNGFNKRFQDLVKEFDSIAAAISSVDDAVTNLQTTGEAIGLTIVPFIADGGTIPVPTGFQQSETIFFAFPESYQAIPVDVQIGFEVFAHGDGTVTAHFLGIVHTPPHQFVVATGIALAKKGGW